MDGGDVGFLAVMVVACCSERGRNLLGDFWSVVAVMRGVVGGFRVSVVSEPLITLIFVMGCDFGLE